MTEIKDLYIYIKDSLTVSYTPINFSLSNYPYAYLKILATPDKNNLQSIYAEYIRGPSKLEQIKFLEEKINLVTLLNFSHHANTSLLTGLRDDFLKRDNQFLYQALDNSPYPGEITPSAMQKYINSVLGGISLTLFAYKVMIKMKTYGPFLHEFPLKMLTIQDLSQNLYLYNSYLINLMDVIDPNHLAKIWLKEVRHFAENWAYLLPVGPAYNNNVAIVNAVYGFTQYLKDKTEENKEDLTTLNEKLVQVYQDIDNLETEMKVKADKILIFTTALSSMTLEKMQKESEIFKMNAETYQNGLTDHYGELKHNLSKMEKRIENLGGSIKGDLEKLENAMEISLDAKYSEVIEKINQHYYDLENSIMEREKRLRRLEIAFEKKISQYIGEE